MSRPYVKLSWARMASAPPSYTEAVQERHAAGLAMRISLHVAGLELLYVLLQPERLDSCRSQVSPACND